MKIVYFKKDELKPSKNNIRKHSKEQIQSIKKSIKKFGFLVPVVIDNKNRILAGHGRVEAVDNKFNIPCVLVDKLSEKQKQAFMVLDNKIYELGETDNILLEQLISNNKELKTLIIDILDNTNKININNLDLTLSDCYSDTLFEKKEKLCPHCGGKL